MEKIEGMILAKHGIKRTPVPVAAASAPAPEKAAPPEKTNGEGGKKVPHLPAKPAN
jgi:hypothetical protein